MHQDALGGLALATVTRHGVTVIQVRTVAAVDDHVSAAVHPNMHNALLEALDRPELPVGDVPLAVWCRKLDAIADRQCPLFLAIDRASLQPPGIVCELPTVLTPDRQQVLAFVDAFHARVRTSLDIEGSAPSRVPDDIALLVACGPLPIGTAQILARHEDTRRPFFPVDVSAFLHRAVDDLVELTA